MLGTPVDAGKVVYVLGAGFSIPAGAPTQAQILGDILELDGWNAKVAEAKTRLETFLIDDLRIRREDIPRIALEDVYTPIDRCIADGTAFKSRNAADLKKIREDLGYLISVAISRRITTQIGSGKADGEYIHAFAEYVVAKAAKRAEYAKDAKDAKRAKAYDPFAIISLNWDILLDNAIHSALWNRDPGLGGDYDPFGVVDYCCYISSVQAGDTRIRSGLWSLGCRGFNVKLLKLHGSMNWLQCPNCQRLFVEYGLKEDILERVGETCCRHCEKYGYKNPLAGSLVMPTFLKDLTNFQVKLVWQNAGVELMEAKRLVFIGYSLPNADFEFRQLLSRMVHQDARIDVVLRKGGSDEDSRRYESTKERYQQFFGDRQIEFHLNGVTEFVEKHISDAASQPAL
ncbi:hypothetical protein FTW19_09320 [Terriglobus albidus]|uniref:Deacetylase sirtuin-type domain-containing protein n=1 Tax=Terriglobus albidus TaxID=1592106 RepID=A0A5B9EDI5_9BACT|nr:hypothetical protein [Terriglobus albidus]QEE28176.1 hypothetical protein FTW19_09320 [Terriglobus albidus]